MGLMVLQYAKIMHEFSSQYCAALTNRGPNGGVYVRGAWL